MPNPTPDKAQDEDDIGEVVIWVFRRKRLLAAIAALVMGGSTTGWLGLEELDAQAEERVLRRQSERRQSAQVKANGIAVKELGDRMMEVESRILELDDLTRMVLQMQMASPHAVAVMESDSELKARAAKAVVRSTE